VDEQVERRRPSPLGGHVRGGQRGVAVDGPDVVREIAIGEMLDLAVQARGFAREADRLVYLPRFIPLAETTIVQAELPVGIPVGRSDPTAECTRHPAHAITGRRGLAREHTPDLVRE
jgi:hypothetical protein